MFSNKNLILRKLLQENDQSDYTIVEQFTDLIEIQTTTSPTPLPSSRRTRTKIFDKLISQPTSVNAIQTTISSLEQSRELLDQTAKKLKSKRNVHLAVKIKFSFIPNRSW
jgi:hypothetical protein